MTRHNNCIVWSVQKFLADPRRYRPYIAYWRLGAFPHVVIFDRTTRKSWQFWSPNRTLKLHEQIWYPGIVCRYLHPRN